MDWNETAKNLKKERDVIKNKLEVKEKQEDMQEKGDIPTACRNCSWFDEGVH